MELLHPHHRAEGEQDERDREPLPVRPERHWELQVLLFGGGDVASGSNVREQDHQPHEDGGEGSQRRDSFEDVGVALVQEDADDEGDDQHDYGHHRHVAVGLRHRPRCQLLLGQPREDAAGAEQVSVDRRQGSAQHDNVEQCGRPADAERVEDLNEGGVLAVDGAPRVDHQDDQDGQHVEDQDARRDGVNRLGDGTVRVLGLSAGNADDLGAAEREQHEDEGRRHAGDAVSEEAAVAPEVAHAHRLGLRAEVEGEDCGTTDDHRHHGANLDQREQELQLTEEPDRRQVRRANDQQRDCDPHPRGRGGEPELHIDRDGRQVRQTHDHHLEGEHPAGDVAAPAAEVLAAVHGKRAADRVAHAHLAERAEHEVHHRAAEEVHQQHRRAGGLDRTGGAVEQAGADGGTERDEVDVAGV